MIVDYGGSKTKAIALDPNGRAVRELTIRSKPLPQLRFEIEKALRRWHIKDLPLLTIGAKSIWSPAGKRWLYQRTKGLAKNVIVLSDVELAYDLVFGRRSGILIIAGTGSIALGRNDRGKFARAGGLGPKKGDEGSAYWIGKTFRRENWKKLGFKSVQGLARLAPKVIGRARKGDPRCQKIVRDAQRHLARLVISVAAKLGLKRKVSVRCRGGLFKNPFFRKGFDKILIRHSGRARSLPPNASIGGGESRNPSLSDSG